VSAVRHVVIGSEGFVGRRLTAALRAEGRAVVGFSRSAAGPGDVAGDLRRPDDLRRLELGPDDVVYLLAANTMAGGPPRRDAERWYAEVNVDGTAGVLAAMRAGGAGRLVFFSTDMTYGRPLRLPVTPDHPQNPLGPYGRTKLAAERLIFAACADGGLSATVFRPRLIVGPGRLGALGVLFRFIRAGLPAPMIGGGGNRYQMVSVNDCVRAAVAAVDAGCPVGAFNLGSDNPRPMRDIVKAIIRRAGTRSFPLPTPAFAVKAALRALDAIGLTVLQPEQVAAADADFVLSTAETTAALGWRPQDDDLAAVLSAYDDFAARN
jgi:nucleoside-diphosphate-sugar epimerase